MVMMQEKQHRLQVFLEIVKEAVAEHRIDEIPNAEK